jgi:WD40 repeat protein
MGVLIVDKFCPQHTDYVKTLAYAPATKRLASGGLDRLVVLWDLDVALSIGHYTRDIKSEVSLRVSRRVSRVCCFLGQDAFSCAPQSAYAMQMNDAGTLVLVGSPDGVRTRRQTASCSIERAC